MFIPAQHKLTPGTPLPPTLTRPVDAQASPAVGFGDSDYRALEAGVDRQFGIRLGEYKADQMRRRLRTLAEKQGHGSFTTLFHAMQSQAPLMTAFLDTMTINVTELMRNPDRFAELTECVLPGLLARRGAAPFAAWSAGCSYGAEAYTLAMLLHEREPAGAHRIKGTDIDLAVLAKANAICFTEQDAAQVSPARRQAHFLDMSSGLPGTDGPLTPRYRPLTHLRSKIAFGRHDLLADPYPTAEYDLILCRNVLIYFTDDAKERIYRGFFQALKPGGVLFVGGTERLSNHQAIGFDLLRPFFYRRPAA